MEAPRHAIVLNAVRSDVDGLARVEIEHRACQARTRAARARAVGQEPGQPTVAEVWALELGRVLIHLRRNGFERYDVKRHLGELAASLEHEPTAAETAEVRRAGHPVGGQVEIVGDDRTGAVQQVQVTREADGVLARWYVVHVAEAQVCRAFACDELESLDIAAAPAPPRELVAV
jgi:hypothetical protein